MAKMYFRKKILLAKVEAVAGTDAAPTGALNAIQTRDLKITPMDADVVQQQLDTGTFGATPGDIVGKRVKVSFKVLLAGSGVAGTAPAMAPLLLACGYKETVVAVTSVAYQPDEDGVQKTVTFYVKQGKVLHKVTYAKGSLKITDKMREYGWFEFEFTGLYVPPIAAVAIVPDFIAFQKPVPARASSVNFSLLAQLVGMQSVTINGGQKVEDYDHSEAESIEHTDRQSSYEAVFEEPEIATHDFFADASAGTLGALQLVHGTVAGNIVQVDAAAVQIRKPDRSEVKGISQLSVSGDCTTDGVVPDHVITFK